MTGKLRWIPPVWNAKQLVKPAISNAIAIKSLSTIVYDRIPVRLLHSPIPGESPTLWGLDSDSRINKTSDDDDDDDGIVHCLLCQ